MMSPACMPCQSCIWRYYALKIHQKTTVADSNGFIIIVSGWWSHPLSADVPAASESQAGCLRSKCDAWWTVFPEIWFQQRFVSLSAVFRYSFLFDFKCFALVSCSFYSTQIMIPSTGNPLCGILSPCDVVECWRMQFHICKPQVCKLMETILATDIVKGFTNGWSSNLTLSPCA